MLTLDTHGVPHRWITWQHACFYYAKDQVAWTLGEHAFTVYGGTNRLTGDRSEITASSIIAVKGKAMAMKSFNQVPPLNNRELFHRDRQICAYCAESLPSTKLTRDHIKPFSKGGKDTWMNVVTACRACNERKSDRTPEGAGMELVYLPYVPEPRRVSDPHQPAHPRRPDGISGAACVGAEPAASKVWLKITAAAKADRTSGNATACSTSPVAAVCTNAANDRSRAFHAGERETRSCVFSRCREWPRQFTHHEIKFQSFLALFLIGRLC